MLLTDIIPLILIIILVVVVRGTATLGEVALRQPAQHGHRGLIFDILPPPSHPEGGEGNASRLEGEEMTTCP